MLKPKVGDLVRLKPMKVEYVSDSGVGAVGDHSFDLDDIEEILPRPLAVGDIVCFSELKDSDWRGQVVAISGDHAWVSWDGPSTRLDRVYQIGLLKRVD